MLRLYNLLQIEIVVSFPISMTTELTLISEIRQQSSAGLRDHFGICLLKVNRRNTRCETRCEICSKLTIKTPKRRQWRRSGVFILNFEHISRLVLVFLLLTLNM